MGERTMSMIKAVVLCGAPGSGKSTWAKAEISKDPNNWVRINNDDIRSMANGSVWSSSYEKLITETRLFLIREAFKRDKNVIVDNVNANKRHFEDVCKLAKEANRDITVFERLFYCELDELLERNAKREGAARVPDEAVKKFFKDLGGKQFRFSNSKVETFTKRHTAADVVIEPMVQNETLPPTIVCDLDGSLARIGNRSPYDASNCDVVDFPMEMTVETVKLYYQAGYKIVFCTGRMEKDRAPSSRFIERCVPGMEYVLFCRPDNDQRKDHIVKEEMFNNNIKGKYWVKLVIDDRNSVVQGWRKMGLVCWQVADGDF
jgi:predicted kinase